VNILRCPKCGVEYPENSDRCQFCGNPKNPPSEGNDGNGEKFNENTDDPNAKNSYFISKLLGLVGIVFFLPLAVFAGIYLVTRKEKSAKYWGLAFILIGGIFWAIGAVMVYNMGYDKFLETYNLTNYNFTNYGIKF
jgi:hypothetical protein